MPLNLDIRVPRNGDYCEDWQLNDNDGLPIDLSADTLELFVRAIAGQGPIVAAASIVIHDAPGGKFTVTIDGAAFAAIDGATEIVRLAYDLRQTFVDGIQFIPVCGHIILTPGATY